MVGRFDASRTCCDGTTTSTPVDYLPIVPQIRLIERDLGNQLAGATSFGATEDAAIGNYIRPVGEADPFPNESLVTHLVVTNPVPWDARMASRVPGDSFEIRFSYMNMAAFGGPPNSMSIARDFHLGIQRIIGGQFAPSPFDDWDNRDFVLEKTAQVGPTTPLGTVFTFDITDFVDYFVANHDQWVVSNTMHFFGFFLYLSTDWFLNGNAEELAAFHTINPASGIADNDVIYLTP